MSIYNDEAVIIKRTNIGEADVVVTLFSKRNGKIQAVVKSARKIKSRKAGRLEIFMVNKLSIARGKNLDIITELVPILDAEDAKSDIKNDALLFYLAETINRFYPEGYASEYIYDLLISMIERLKVEMDAKYIMMVIIKMIKEQGDLVSIDECSLCGKTFTEESEIYFDANLNSFVDKCGENRSSTSIEVSKTMYKIFKFMLNSDIEALGRLNVKEENLTIGISLTNRIIENIIGQEMRSFNFLLSLNNG